MVRIMRQVGPALFYSTMRFESKHRELRLFAVTSNNRVNAPKTLAIRSLLKLAFLKFTGKLDFSDYEPETVSPIDSYDRSVYFPDSGETDNIICTDKIEAEGYYFKIGMVLVTAMGDDDLLSFGRISKIFIKNKEVSFLFENLDLINHFDYHLNAYCVEETKKVTHKKFKDVPEINACYFIKTENSRNEAYVVPPYVL